MNVSENMNSVLSGRCSRTHVFVVYRMFSVFITSSRSGAQCKTTA